MLSGDQRNTRTFQTLRLRTRRFRLHSKLLRMLKRQPTNKTPVIQAITSVFGCGNCYNCDGRYVGIRFSDSAATRTAEQTNSRDTSATRVGKRTHACSSTVKSSASSARRAALTLSLASFLFSFSMAVASIRHQCARLGHAQQPMTKMRGNRKIP